MIYSYKVLIHDNPPFNRYLLITNSKRILSEKEVKTIADDFVKGETVLFIPEGTTLTLI